MEKAVKLLTDRYAWVFIIATVLWVHTQWPEASLGVRMLLVFVIALLVQIIALLICLLINLGIYLGGDNQ